MGRSTQRCSQCLHLQLPTIPSPTLARLLLPACAGAPLQLGDLRPSVRLQTQPLTMDIQQVQSAAAMAATGGQWSASLGSPDDQLPEVPPDGEQGAAGWAARFVQGRGSICMSAAALSCAQTLRRSSWVARAHAPACAGTVQLQCFEWDAQLLVCVCALGAASMSEHGNAFVSMGACGQQ